VISIEHPEVLALIRDVPYGIIPITNRLTSEMSLLIKAPKEVILATRVNREFRIYAIPDLSKEKTCFGLISAFFDDHDEPLTLTTPLFAGDEMSEYILRCFTQKRCKIYFFDELNREMMGFEVETVGIRHLDQCLRQWEFPPFDTATFPEQLTYMERWFSTRTEEDDTQAWTVRFDTPLYDDDMVIIDARPTPYELHGNGGGPALLSLEREEPGEHQERDIAGLLCRSFSGDQILLNPVRKDTGKELADIVCVTDEFVLVVQAKDSPNTETSLRRSIDRKRAAIRGHISKAARQVRGALAYIRRTPEATLVVDKTERQVAFGNRELIGLVVVNELFDDDYRECSAPVMEVIRELQRPCLLLSYSSLHNLTLRFDAPLSFANALFDILDVALEHGEFPKPRFLSPPGEQYDSDTATEPVT